MGQSRLNLPVKVDFLGQEVALIFKGESSGFQLGRHLSRRLTEVGQVHPTKGILEQGKQLYFALFCE